MTLTRRAGEVVRSGRSLCGNLCESVQRYVQVERHALGALNDRIGHGLVVYAGGEEEAPGVFVGQLAHQVLMEVLRPLRIQFFPAQLLSPGNHPQHTGQVQDPLAHPLIHAEAVMLQAFAFPERFVRIEKQHHPFASHR